jgi:hypothetical protein
VNNQAAGAAVYTYKNSYWPRRNEINDKKTPKTKIFGDVLLSHAVPSAARGFEITQKSIFLNCMFLSASAGGTRRAPYLR